MNADQLDDEIGKRMSKRLANDKNQAAILQTLKSIFPGAEILHTPNDGWFEVHPQKAERGEGFIRKAKLVSSQLKQRFKVSAVKIESALLFLIAE